MEYNEFDSVYNEINSVYNEFNSVYNEINSVYNEFGSINENDNVSDITTSDITTSDITNNEIVIDDRNEIVIENQNEIVIDDRNERSSIINTIDETENYDTYENHDRVSIEENLEILKRRIRGLTQRIILLDIKRGENNDIFLKILGSKDNIYTIHIWTDWDKITCDCTCPDNKFRGLECKHILWLSLRKLGKTETKLWTVDDINNLYYYWNSIYCYPPGRNDMCPICLENIDYGNENTISCFNGCNNSIHSFCWSKYYIISQKTRCVICRKLTMPHIEY